MSKSVHPCMFDSLPVCVKNAFEPVIEKRKNEKAYRGVHSYHGRDGYIEFYVAQFEDAKKDIKLGRFKCDKMAAFVCCAYYVDRRVICGEIAINMLIEKLINDPSYREEWLSEVEDKIHTIPVKGKKRKRIMEEEEEEVVSQATPPSTNVSPNPEASRAPWIDFSSSDDEGRETPRKRSSDECVECIDSSVSSCEDQATPQTRSVGDDGCPAVALFMLGVFDSVEDAKTSYDEKRKTVSCKEEALASTLNDRGWGMRWGSLKEGRSFLVDGVLNNSFVKVEKGEEGRYFTDPLDSTDPRQAEDRWRHCVAVKDGKVLEREFRTSEEWLWIGEDGRPDSEKGYMHKIYNVYEVWPMVKEYNHDSYLETVDSIMWSVRGFRMDLIGCEYKAKHKIGEMMQEQLLQMLKEVDPRNFAEDDRDLPTHKDSRRIVVSSDRGGELMKELEHVQRLSKSLTDLLDEIRVPIGLE